MSVHDTQNESTRDGALEAATAAIRDGKLIVLPTDTVYGIGADAFTADAVQALLDAKGRGRDVPPPVLVGDQAVLLALAVDVPEYAERLAEAFWPGPLTVILKAQPSLNWDLGETRGTVALRMPDDEVALQLLRSTGPMAVSSANRHGKDAALTVMDAATQLGDAVEVYLDAGQARLGTSSTIIDTTVEPPEIVREGALGKDEIIAAVGDIFTAPEPEEPEEQEGTEQTADPEANGEPEQTAAPEDTGTVEGAGTDPDAAGQASTDDSAEGAPPTDRSAPAADGTPGPDEENGPAADHAEETGAAADEPPSGAGGTPPGVGVDAFHTGATTPLTAQGDPADRENSPG